MRRIIGVAALLLAARLPAQEVRGAATFELRPFIGAFVPTGVHRELLKDAAMVGVQAALELRQHAHLLASFAWAPDRTKELPSDRGVGIYQYDLGVELFRERPWSCDRALRPFFGGGIGARTYRTERSVPAAQTNLAGYAALGSELQLGGVALRLEARDYLSEWKGLAGTDDRRTRNDVTVMTGLAVHFK